MNTRSVLLALLVLAAFGAGLCWSQLPFTPVAYADGTKGGNGTVVTPLGPEGEEVAKEAPVVGCTPYAYTTENELDPFDSTKIRRTKTTVTQVVLVRADGTTEVRKIKE